MAVECCICLDDIENVDAVKMKCGRLFHEDCLLKWLNKSETCPWCRDPVDKKSLKKIHIGSDADSVSTIKSFQWVEKM